MIEALGITTLSTIAVVTLFAIIPSIVLIFAGLMFGSIISRRRKPTSIPNAASCWPSWKATKSKTTKAGNEQKA